MSVVHFELQKCLRQFSEKLEMEQLGKSEAWGKMIHEKNSKQKNLVTLSL